VIEEIGDGAMGRVWRGHDPLIGRPVALKTVKSEYLTRETRDEYLQRFRREARAAGLLSHPNIVSLYDVGDDYFVMELLEGATLGDLIRARGRLPLDEVLALLEPVADAIDYAHRSGVIHRDIKPANIMVQPDGRPKLMDFGVARLETSIMTAPGHFFGSPSYMAPEQITSSDATPRSDLFSLAVVAYEALTGQRPFSGDSITAIIYQVVNGSAPPPTSLVTDLPASYDDVFQRALAKKPEHRFSTARSLMEALRGEAFEPPAREATPPVESVSVLGLDVPEIVGGGTPPRAALGGAETLDISAAGRRATRTRGRWSLWSAAAATLSFVTAGMFAVVRLPAAREALAAASGLSIETEPAGAAVWIDGVEAGSAPIVLPGVAPGLHRLRVVREGYASAELTLQVAEGMGLVPLRFALAGVTAPVEIRAGDGVTVRIDGHEVGRTPLAPVHVAPGVHEIRLERRGFVPQRHSVLARVGEPILLSARLVPSRAAVAMTLPRPEEIYAVTPVDPDPPPAPVSPARPVTTRPASYPEPARRLRMSGTVLVEATVEPSGHVSSVQVLESAGTVLDEAVVEAVRAWVFSPAHQAGQPVVSKWRYRQTFRAR
jgi:TonB family protein